MRKCSKAHCRVIRLFQGSTQGFSEKFEIRTRTTMRAKRYLSDIQKYLPPLSLSENFQILLRTLSDNFQIMPACLQKVFRICSNCFRILSDYLSIIIIELFNTQTMNKQTSSTRHQNESNCRIVLLSKLQLPSSRTPPVYNNIMNLTTI